MQDDTKKRGLEEGKQQQQRSCMRRHLGCLWRGEVEQQLSVLLGRAAARQRAQQPGGIAAAAGTGGSAGPSRTAWSDRRV